MFTTLLLALGLDQLIAVSSTVWLPLFVVMTLFAVAMLVEHVASGDTQ